MSDLTQCTVEQLQTLFRGAAVSPVEVTQEVLLRIQRINPLINAFCLVDEEAALASARISEQRWQAHPRNAAPVGVVSSRGMSRP